MSAISDVLFRRLIPAAVVGALVLTGCGGGGGPNGKPKSIDQYVSMGDSYTAAPGLLPIVDANCVRSGSNYPSLVAKALSIKDFDDASCGGARTNNLIASQQRGVFTVNRAQIRDVNRKTDLVTLGIGMNNEGLSADVLYLCLPQLNNPAGCREYLAHADEVISKAIEKIAEQLVVSLRAIHRRAPDARVVLVGYPRVLPDQGDCADVLPLTGEAGEGVRLAFKAADAAFREAARKGDADYIDMYAASVGHDVCSDDPWVNGATDGGPNGAALHPTPAYQQAVADKLVALIGE